MTHRTNGDSTFECVGARLIIFASGKAYLSCVLGIYTERHPECSSMTNHIRFQTHSSLFCPSGDVLEASKATVCRMLLFPSFRGSIQGQGCNGLQDMEDLRGRG